MASMVRYPGKVLAIGAIVLPLLCQAEPSVVGTWELTYVAPQAIGNTLPGGVTNTKMYFTAGGKLFALEPDAVSIQDVKSADYTFDGRTLKLSEAGVQFRAMTISFPDDETMVASQRAESQRTFTRIPAFDQKLEPKSLQLVADKSNDAIRLVYDVKDYSSSPMSERLRGFWEVVAYENVPRDQAPPYGFFNDLWTIDHGKVVISRREPSAIDSVPFSYKDGQFSSSGIGLGGPPGSKVNWKPSFNEWGNLVLDGPYCRMVLKLVSKSTVNPSAVPLKVVILRLN
jgi:hypothetical protein